MMADSGSFLKRYLETDLSKKTADVKIFQFIGPWILWAILAGGSALVFYLIQNWESAKNLLYVWWFYMIPPMGKEVIIPRTLSQDHHPPALVVALATSGVDMVLSLFMIWNYDWVKKVPVLGPRIVEAEERGRERMKKTRWFSKVSFIATAMFVSVPFSGAGGWFGTVFGRLIGVKPYKVLLAVFIGSTVEAFGYALLADSLMPYLEDSSFFEWLSNVNILQFFAAFGMLALLIYVVRHPREAVRKTSTGIRKSIEISEKAVLKAEDLGSRGLEFSVMRSSEAIDLLSDMYDHVLGSIPVVMGDDIRIIDGRDGQIISDLRESSIDALRETNLIARESIKESLHNTEKTAGMTSHLLSKYTLVGLEVMKEGAREGEFLVLMAGDSVEKVVRIPGKNSRKIGL
jgi:uncharacterized membrane protein